MSLLASKYAVLVVDDSPVQRKLVEQVLSGQDAYQLIFASNGQEALTLFQQHLPSIVLTDWMMPDFSGLELCERIRADATQPYTYIILMTSNTEKGNVVKGLQAGADDYLAKPFDPGEMLARIGVGRRIIDLNRELAAKSVKLEEAARTDPLTSFSPTRHRSPKRWCRYATSMSCSAAAATICTPCAACPSTSCRARSSASSVNRGAARACSA